VYIFDLDTGVWKEAKQMNFWRDELSATVGPEGYIYVIGGYGGSGG